MHEKMISAMVIDMVGLKDGIFMRELAGPGIEPWFVVACYFSGANELTFFTKDVKSYYQIWKHYLDVVMSDANVHMHDLKEFLSEFLPEEQVLVKQAIERYVMEVAN